MFGRKLNTRATQAKVCPQCSGQLLLVRRCPYIAMQCTKCGKVHEFHAVAEQIDDAFEEGVGWLPLDRL